MMSENDLQPKEPETQKIETGQKQLNLSQNLVFVVVLLSLLFGSAGGVFGALYLAKLPRIQKYFSATPSELLSQSQKINLNEDSAIIDVVKQAGPAVVSIVISKDLSKLPGYGNSPFGSDPFFFQFFGDSGQPNSNDNQSSNNQPNIQKVGAGSGFFVSGDGLILTNKHVVADSQASYTVITQDGKTYPAKILSQDPVNDLAIVKVDIKNAPYLILSDSGSLQVGQRVVAIGNSLGQYQNTVTSGIISGIGRSITAGGEGSSEDLQGVIQTDAAINPGNSGGPLLDLAGQVVGINTAIDQQGQLVGFAIPSNDIQRALASFQKNGRITRAYLGVRYLNITQALADEQKLPRNYGALLVRGNTSSDLAVIPGSPADKAGLAENDIILEVNGKKLDASNSLSGLLRNYNPGDTVTLKVYDKGNEKEIKVALVETK